jgi:hypothetical protein
MACKSIKKLSIIVILMGSFSTAFAGNIDPNNDGSQYAYGENVGWLNFEPNAGPGVTVTSTNLTGYIWAENIGWIKLNPTYGGITNDGTGLLSGYAWGENVGWINFNPTVSGSQDYGVTIDGSGNFSGWAWGENVGWIHLQAAMPVFYKVQTSWITSCIVDFNDLAEFCQHWLTIDKVAVGHWPFDEGAGPTAIDAGSGGNNGTLFGNAAWVNDPVRGMCLDFDGNGDYVKTADTTTGLNFAPNSFSVSAWLYPRTVTGNWRTILEYNRAGYNWFGIWLNSTGKFHFRVGSDTQNSIQSLNPNQWYFLTATYNSIDRKMSLYINGQFDNFGTQTADFTSPVSAKLTIGTRGSEDAEYINGKIDDVRIYDFTLTDLEIQALFNGYSADFNGDGHVDFADYALLAEFWLGPCPPGWPVK